MRNIIRPFFLNAKFPFFFAIASCISFMAAGDETSLKTKTAQTPSDVKLTNHNLDNNESSEFESGVFYQKPDGSKVSSLQRFAADKLKGSQICINFGSEKVFQYQKLNNKALISVPIKASNKRELWDVTPQTLSFSLASNFVNRNNNNYAFFSGTECYKVESTEIGITRHYVPDQYAPYDNRDAKVVYKINLKDPNGRITELRMDDILDGAYIDSKKWSSGTEEEKAEIKSKALKLYEERRTPQDILRVFENAKLDTSITIPLSTN